MASCDVIVVGMRCAGAALALLLVRAGHSVLALGRASFPSDTVSTHFLRPRTTAFLAKWGLLDSLAAYQAEFRRRRRRLHLPSKARQSWGGE
ncbi:FAD-dependent monooxygenase [Reyranella sp.]|uniref:FAD-dependent monooxygenase n=1 Tax=Reyranella sp. TaxID=1929291 RepID=UPI00378376C9